MSNKLFLQTSEVIAAAQAVANFVRRDYPTGAVLYGIPRGGVPAVYAVLSQLDRARYGLTDFLQHADVIVDDIYDSGATAARYLAQKPMARFYPLIGKDRDMDAGYYIKPDTWVVFPWEQSEEGSAEDIVTRMLQFIGEDPAREGLRETPARVIKAWKEWFDGYGMDEADIFKTFQDGAEKCDEMVIVRDIPVESFCEHHMAAFTGVAHVGYIPDGKIIGLSKIARLVRMYSHRLQVQERLTNQIADAMDKHLAPKGVAVVIEAAHTCMSSRGARVHGTQTITSALRGVIKDKPEARAEFLALVK